MKSVRNFSGLIFLEGWGGEGGGVWGFWSVFLYFLYLFYDIYFKQSLAILCTRLFVCFLSYPFQNPQYLLFNLWFLNKHIKFLDNICALIYSKEYIEGRHSEASKLLFLPKVGLLGSQNMSQAPSKCLQKWIKVDKLDYLKNAS